MRALDFLKKWASLGPHDEGCGFVWGREPCCCSLRDQVRQRDQDLMELPIDDRMLVFIALSVLTDYDRVPTLDGDCH